MQPFLFGERSGIHIIDLEQIPGARGSLHASSEDLGRRRGIVLFVGTKKQAQDVVAEQAERVGMPFVNHRWLGGMLTNFTDDPRRLRASRSCARWSRAATSSAMPKKEAIRLGTSARSSSATSAASGNGAPARCGLRDRHQEGAHRGQRGATSWASRSSPSLTRTATPTRSTWSSPATTTRSRAAACRARIADAIAEGYGMARTRPSRRHARSAEARAEAEAAPAAVDEPRGEAAAMPRAGFEAAMMPPRAPTRRRGARRGTSEAAAAPRHRRGRGAAPVAAAPPPRRGRPDGRDHCERWSRRCASAPARA